MEFKAKEIAEILGGTVDGNPDATVSTFARIESGKPGAICFFANPKYEHYVYECKADVIIVNKTFEPQKAVSATMVRVDDAYAAVNLLKDNDFVASLTSVLAVEIPDEAGGLDKLLQYFADAEVNIEYMYAFLGGKKEKKAYMIFRVADTKKAEISLKKMGLYILSQEEIEEI